MNGKHCVGSRLWWLCLLALSLMAWTQVGRAAPSLSTLYNFAHTHGAYPTGALIQGHDGALYGTTSFGGANEDGTVFQITPSGTLTTLYSFSGSDGSDPIAGLVQGKDGALYGATNGGGAYGLGTVFQITTSSVLTTLHSFQGGDGSDPETALIQGQKGVFYGTTYAGGKNGDGTLFQITPAGVLTTLYSFSALKGGFGASNPDGAYPSGLMQGTDGNFYGTTYFGGKYGSGTVFQITAAGVLTTLYSFSALGSGGTNADGGNPSGLMQGTNGNLYGVTAGGKHGSGTVFQITTAGVLTTLYSFRAVSSTGTNADGAGPVGLIQGQDGALYGTTFGGGAYAGPIDEGAGTVFKITTAGVLTTLYSFSTSSSGVNADGANPYTGVIQGTDGNLYGTTFDGGAYGLGTVFRITTSGVLTTLYSFSALSSRGINRHGANPGAGLMRGTNGNLYGTTFDGGTHGGGTVFKITAAGALTTLYSFGATSSDGANPIAGLIQCADGNLYGTTYYGGANDLGTVFQITTSGALTICHSFNRSSGAIGHGARPYAGLMQAMDGNLYGTTVEGGASGEGTVFRMSLTPIITSFSPMRGPVGTSVTLTGANFSTAKLVKLGALNALFTINSDTSLTFVVPSPGAASARITVVNPFGTGTSQKVFTMTPDISRFSPAKGPPGTSVTLKGVNFTGTTAVNVGAFSASFTINSDTTLTFVVPAGAKSAKISVVNPYGTGSSHYPFTVTP